MISSTVIVRELLMIGKGIFGGLMPVGAGGRASPVTCAHIQKCKRCKEATEGAQEEAGMYGLTCIVYFCSHRRIYKKWATPLPTL